jgi:hypothetical protein
MSRRVWFIVAILAGITLGLVYGWVINPVQYVETSPDTLRADYKTDYVLMVAEAYHAEGDLTLAVRRLAILGNTPPLEMVQQAIVFAGQSGYSPKDVDVMLKLSQGLKTWSPETQGAH